MSDISILATLQDAVDMALGSPELGAVNFNLLNAVLQLVMKQIKLNDRYVQIKGPDNESIRTLMGSTHPNLPVKFAKYDPILGLREFALETQRTEPEGIERNWKIVILEPSGGPKDIVEQPEIIVPVNEERFINLESDMKDIKGKIEDIMELPNDSNILKAMRPVDGLDGDQTNNLTPVRDMWQFLSLRKRVDATELGIESLSDTFDIFMNEILETLCSSTGNIQANNSLLDDSYKAMTLKYMQSVESRVPNRKPSVLSNLIERVDVLEKTLESQTNERSQSSDQMLRLAVPQSEELVNLINQVETIKQIVKSLEADVIDGSMRIEELSHLEEMFTDLEKIKTIVTNLAEQQEILSRILKDKLEEFSEYKTLIDEMQDNMGLFQQKSPESGKLSRKSSEAVYDASFTALTNKVSNLEKALLEMSLVAQELTQGLRERKIATDGLTAEIEAIKRLKANQKDVVAALSEKAEVESMTNFLHEKVSHDEFETAYRELKTSVAETRNLFTEQEKLWNETLADIRVTVQSKINKIDELESLRSSVNDKIKALKRRLRAVAAAKEDQEAAATKSKLLKDVNCISCDKQVVMKRENEHSLFPIPPLVPGKPSMKPYHTYQLDSVRRQSSCLHETNPRQRKPSKKTGTDVSPRPGYLSNRYYGGSHTVTTAKERVPRTGHFLDQWGPRIEPLQETYMQGTDGKVYKSREAAGKKSHKNKYKIQ